MLNDIAEQLDQLRGALDRLTEGLTAPGAKRLKGLPLAKLAVALDQVGGKLAKARAALAKAANGNGRTE